MNVYKRFVLFAINNKDKEVEVENYLEMLGIDFKKVMGCYQGSVEDSYMAIIDTDDKLNIVFEIAASYNQESILVVDEHRVAYLHYVLTGDVKKLGDFKAIDAIAAQELDGWTLDGTQYYAVV